MARGGWGPGFELCAGGVHFAEEFFAPGDLFGQGLRVGVFAVAGFGLGEQCVHVEAELRAQFARALVGDVFVFAGAGADVGAVEAHAAELEQAQFARQLEHIDEGGGHGLEVVAAEGADGVVIGMGVGAEVAHGQVAVGGALDAAAAEDAVGVAVDEQGEHHRRRELRVAATAVVDREGAQRQPLDGLDDEVDQVILGDPVAQVGREKQGGLTVDVDEAGGHARF